MRYAKSKSYLRISLESQVRSGRKVLRCVRRREHNTMGAANRKVIGQRRTPARSAVEEIPKIGCWDTEDVEGWLVEEGIGYFDRCGIFHYGVQPGDDYDYDPGAAESVFDDGAPDPVEGDG